jgi:rod shape-determining protein MreB
VALEQELTAEIRGRDLVTGLPKTITITTGEIATPSRSPLLPSSTP